MADITGTRKKPAIGDWVWLVCTEYAADGHPWSLRPVKPDEQPTHVRIYAPLPDPSSLAAGMDTATVAIRGHGTQSNGHSWTWNGSRGRPTLRPSVDGGAHRWHGFLTDGLVA